MLTAALFIIARTWNQPKRPSTGDWRKKEWSIYAMEYYSAMKKDKTMPFAATWMDTEIVLLSQVSKPEERKMPYDTTCMWNLKNRQK